MRAFLFLLFATSALAQLPSLPPVATTTKLLSPKHAEHVASLGAPMLKASVAPAQPNLWLSWNYPADQLTNVVFQVFHSFIPAQGPPLTRYDQIPTGFTLMSVVDGFRNLSIDHSAAAEYFIVRAMDKISGVFSNWNQP